MLKYSMQFAFLLHGSHVTNLNISSLWQLFKTIQSTNLNSLIGHIYIHTLKYEHVKLLQNLSSSLFFKIPQNNLRFPF
jgi:hypothetical protein